MYRESTGPRGVLLCSEEINKCRFRKDGGWEVTKTPTPRRNCVAPARRRHKCSWDTFGRASAPRRLSGARVADLGQLEHGREIEYCVQKAEKVMPEAFSVARGYLRDEHGVSPPSTEEDSVPHVSDSQGTSPHQQHS